MPREKINEENLTSVRSHMQRERRKSAVKEPTKVGSKTDAVITRAEGSEAKRRLKFQVKSPVSNNTKQSVRTKTEDRPVDLQSACHC